jgi:DNA repair protein RecO (recombination protein O)
MTTTYKATGINLKGTPLGESDRLLTVLTREHGLVRVVAPGARKANSKLGGRSALFVVNDLLISKGRSLDRIVQAESLESYPGLSQDLRKLTAGQYLAEMVLFQALSHHPQEDLYCLLNEHLTRLEETSAPLAIACLTHAIYHFLATAGVPPQVHECCLTQRALGLEPNLDWAAGFSAAAGGVIHLQSLSGTAGSSKRRVQTPVLRQTPSPAHRRSAVAETSTPYQVSAQERSPSASRRDSLIHLSPLELAILQSLSQPSLIRADGCLHLDSDLTLAVPELSQPIAPQVWLKLERALRHYTEYQFDRPVRSARLIDTCFDPAPGESRSCL